MTAAAAGTRSACYPCSSSLLILALTAAGVAAVQRDRAQDGEQRAQDAQKQNRIAIARQLMAKQKTPGPTTPAPQRSSASPPTGFTLVTRHRPAWPLP